MKVFTKRFTAFLTVCAVFLAFSTSSFAQGNEEPIAFKKKLTLTIDVKPGAERENIPVHVPISQIRNNAKDFNPAFYRIKHPAQFFEPLDIPSQIVIMPGSDADEGEIVFTVDIPSNGTKEVVLQYNPTGEDYANYPAKTQSFAQWYRLGSNIAWENEIMAYRSYSGVLDFFAKSYSHLRLHNLPPDSYHHERFWGLDPYMIGTKPGICGVMLIDGDKKIPCYGDPEAKILSFKHTSINGGPAVTGAQVAVSNSEGGLVTETFMLYDGRYENHVTTVLDEKLRGKGILVSPGVQKFDGIPVVEGNGFLAVSGSPVEEYGTIYTGLVWNPADAGGSFETDEGKYVILKPDANGAVKYYAVALWNRKSDANAVTAAQFSDYLLSLAADISNPAAVTVSVTR